MRDAKPLDAGSGRVCASFDRLTAAWLSVGAPHPLQGFVELSALPAFDERRRGDPAATRRYRLEMTNGAHAFLVVEIDGQPPVLVAETTDVTRPRWAAGTVTVVVDPEPDGSAIRQHWTIGPARGSEVRIRVRGRLDRPALAEITETDPPPPTGATTTMGVDGGVLRLEAPALPASAVVSVSGAEVEWITGDGQVVGSVRASVGGAPLRFTVEARLPHADAAGRPSPSISRASPDPLVDPLVVRALAYVRGCTALRVATDERVVLTDHRMLPLSWTRDAYWQALALLAADGPGDRERVADHLRWLWRRCRRPDARWTRSHHANGERKDLAFQADQQLYPILELADYWRSTSTLPADVAWGPVVARAWEAALEAVDPRTGLIGSDENAADDPATAPYIAASQILLWYVSLRAAELADAGALALDAAAVRRVAGAARDGFSAHLADRPGPWPYAVDGAGLRIAYHDANDLPVPLAPLWGFCRVDDPGWTATMAFAFSTDNPGWSGGRDGGLGSHHTPGAWTLGDVQAWLRALLTGSRQAAAAARRRLDEAAFSDGMLPEAYTADGTRVRHWFAWPGAALAAVSLLERRGVLGERLAARAVG